MPLIEAFLESIRLKTSPPLLPVSWTKHDHNVASASLIDGPKELLKIFTENTGLLVVVIENDQATLFELLLKGNCEIAIFAGKREGNIIRNVEVYVTKADSPHPRNDIQVANIEGNLRILQGQHISYSIEMENLCDVRIRD